jgi:pimeloyl-ACP methyl ester carboxylesterase
LDRDVISGILKISGDYIQGFLNMMKIETKAMKVYGRDVLYYTAGQGDPLVVIHGGGCDARTWLSNIELLAEKYTVYAPDLPGYGGSQRIEGHYYIPELAQFIEDFTSQLGLQKFYLVGHSLGGGIALNFALMFPEKIRKLVLISSLCLGREVAFWLRVFTIPGIVKNFGKTLTAVTRGIKQAMAYLNPASLIMEMTPAAVMIGGSVTTWHSQTLVLEKRLPEVKMPTLLVWGGRDPVVPVMQAYRAAKVIPDCRIEVFKKRGHNVHREELQGFSAILTHFLG